MARTPLTTVQCETCGKPLKRDRNWLSRTKHHFCNKACHNEWQRAHYPRGKTNPKYKSVSVKCANCGAALTRPPHRIRDHARHFCNHTCMSQWFSKHVTGENHPGWKGGYDDYYGPNWWRQKRAARKRDGYRCQHCGIEEKKLTQSLDVHHIVPFRTFGYVRGENNNHRQANALSNLISLCRPCHKRAEHGLIPIQPKLV